MIHRRCLKDDFRGVAEPLNETEPDGSGVGLKQSVRHYIVFNGGDYRAVQKRNDQRMIPFFAPTASNTFSKNANRQASLQVPSDIKLYLRPYEDGSYLLRLHNTNAKQTVN